MSAQANIVAFDGAATPVSHTLVPMGAGIDLKLGSAIVKWSEKIASLPDEAQVRATMTKQKLKNGTTRVALNVEVPIMETVTNQNAAGYTAAPKVAFVDVIQVVGYHSPRSTVNSRRLVRQLALNIAGSVATSVVPVTTGPFPELVDQGIAAS